MAEPAPLEVVVPGAIWTSERPVWFGGVRLRSRTTVVRLAGGALWVHSPGPPTVAMSRAIDALGEVRWIVVPNRFHHLQTPAMAARYPNAQVVAPASAQQRNPSLTLPLSTDAPAYVRSTPELVPVPLEGVPFLDETMFFHHASGSLVAADLLITACPRDHWTWRTAARLWGRYGQIRTPPDVRMRTRASAALSASLARLRVLPLQRILVAHADPITDQPVERLREAWAFADRSL